MSGYNYLLPPLEVVFERYQIDGVVHCPILINVNDNKL